MLKLLGIIVLFIIFIVLLGVMMFASVILSFLRRFRKFTNNQQHEADSDYTGRRQQQYSYRRQGTAGQQSYGSRQHNDNSRTTDETVYNTRSQQQAGKKIFADDEGEYVDFVEEK